MMAVVNGLERIVSSLLNATDLGLERSIKKEAQCVLHHMNRRRHGLPRPTGNSDRDEYNKTGRGNNDNVVVGTYVRN
jgi:hypothetical protein